MKFVENRKKKLMKTRTKSQFLRFLLLNFIFRGKANKNRNRRENKKYFLLCFATLSPYK